MEKREKKRKLKSMFERSGAPLHSLLSIATDNHTVYPWQFTTPRHRTSSSPCYLQHVEKPRTHLCVQRCLLAFSFFHREKEVLLKEEDCGRLWVFMRFYIFMDLIGKMELNVNYILCGIDYILLNITEYNILLDIVKYNG